MVLSQKQIHGHQQIWNKQCHGQHSLRSVFLLTGSFIVLFFILFIAVLFSLPLVFDCGWIYCFQRSLETSALCKKSWSWMHRSVVVGHQCWLRRSSGACFIFYVPRLCTHMHKDRHTMIKPPQKKKRKKVSMCHSLTLLTNTTCSFSPHCFLCFIRFM